MKTFYLLRHGQTDWNKEGRIQGHLDVPLNETGRFEALRLEPVFARLKIEAIVSSDLGRAVETARLAIPHGPHFQDPRLRETHLGKLQGLTREEIHAQFGEGIWDRMKSQPLTDSDIADLGAETGGMVFNRTLHAVEDFLHRENFSRVAFVTHGGVLRNLFRFLKIADHVPFPIPNAALFEFAWDPNLDEGRIRYLNFTKISKN